MSPTKSPERVLLLYPRHNPPSIVLDPMILMEPLALEYLAAAVPGRQVRIVDLRIENDPVSHLKDFRPDLVGITGFSMHVNSIRMLAAQVKSELPGATVMVGGHHATVRPQDFDVPEIDLIVSGEGCSAVAEMMESWGRWQGILGLAYLKDGKRVYNSPRPHPPLDNLPMPRRELTEKYARHYHYGWEEGAALFRTSLGCPFRCSFCALWSITGGRYIARSIESVLTELKRLKAEAVFFADDENTLDYRRMMDLAAAIADSGLRKKYYFWSRADTIVAHPDLFRVWKGVGLTGVSVGLEAADQRRLDLLNKNLSLDTQRRAIEILHGLGLLVEPSFIITPDYTVEDFRKLGRYIRENRLWKASISIMTPLPGTRLWDEYRDQLTTREWECWDFNHLVVRTKLSEEEFYRHFFRLYRSVMPLPVAVFKYLPKYRLRRLLARLGYDLRLMWLKMLSGEALKSYWLNGRRKGP
jgi:radical SAM superfamily enzyme YgiQ (UPF0313 family)